MISKFPVVKSANSARTICNRLTFFAFSSLDFLPLSRFPSRISHSLKHLLQLLLLGSFSLIIIRHLQYIQKVKDNMNMKWKFLFSLYSVAPAAQFKNNHSFKSTRVIPHHLKSFFLFRNVPIASSAFLQPRSVWVRGSRHFMNKL